MSTEAIKQEPVGVVNVLPLGEGHKPMHWADWTDSENPPPEGTPLYTTPPGGRQSEDCLTAAPVQTPITEEMHVAAVKVLQRANGVDGLPQRMLDAMLAAQPAAPVQEPNQSPYPEYDRGFSNGWDRGFAAAQSAPVQEPVLTPDDQVPERMKTFVKLHHITARDFNAFYIGFCCGEDSATKLTPPAAPVQEPISVILSQWKSGAIGAAEAILELFKHYPSKPSIEATPPAAQRPVAEPHKWVGLTDEEMWQEWNAQGDDEMNQQAAIAFARAIEAKLREKNGGAK